MSEEFIVQAVRYVDDQAFVTTYRAGEDVEYITVETEAEGPVLLLQDADENNLAAFRTWDVAYKDGVLVAQKTQALRIGNEDYVKRPAVQSSEPSTKTDDDDADDGDALDDILWAPLNPSTTT